MYLKINDVDEHVCLIDFERDWFDQRVEPDRNLENIYHKTKINKITFVILVEHLLSVCFYVLKCFENQIDFMIVE